jgi:hypothetical protein
LLSQDRLVITPWDDHHQYPKKSKYNFGLSLKFETLNFEAVRDIERWMLEGAQMI